VALLELVPILPRRMGEDLRRPVPALRMLPWMHYAGDGWGIDPAEGMELYVRLYLEIP
jgi:hypothetical protein